MDEDIKVMFRRHAEAVQKRQENYDLWLKGIIAIATGLEALLISLKTIVSKTQCQHLFYIISIALLALGILFGTIRLFSVVASLDQELKVHLEHIQKRSFGQNGDLVDFVKPNKLYKFSGYISSASFLLSLISLVIYACLMDK